MKATRRTSKRHDGYCRQVVWGGDSRYTKCEDCGVQRFYPDGYNDELEFSPYRKVTKKATRAKGA